MRYLLHLAYDGTHFHGWQRQPQVVSVQSTLEDSLTHLLKTPITVVGCGRTDAGVHASDYYAHFEYPAALPKDLRRKLNLALPNSIVVNECKAVTPRWHARFSAQERSYIYYGNFSKSPFNQHFSTYFPHKNIIDWPAMKEAAALLPHYRDFRAYCKVPDRHDSTLCTITAAHFVRNTVDQFEFHISANRFLRGMVRLLVAELMEVGTGKRTVANVQHCLTTGERPPYFKQAPPQGLQLASIYYPSPTKDLETLADIKAVIDTFYQYARQDELIGYIFEDVVQVDWEHHLPRIYAFWETVLFAGHGYSGNPVQVHRAIHQKEHLHPAHFERWLTWWQAVINEQFVGEKAELMKNRAASMAQIMLAKLSSQY